MKQTYLDIFRELNSIPRPSHHEEKIADYLCRFAERHGLRYRRDARNCVVIEKDATPGFEESEPIVILNHMDMVCAVRNDYLRDGRKFNPLTDGIRSYIEEEKKEDGSIVRWMKAEGTSLGADNGIGLSMALAVLSDDSIVHGPLEVLTTTNEEDGMSGAEALSSDFIKGRRIINLDSEAYEEITVGAAGAYLQTGIWKKNVLNTPGGLSYRKITLDGGLGGHSGVDINKGRCNCIKELAGILNRMDGFGLYICSMDGGSANASIAAAAEVVVAFEEQYALQLEKALEKERLRLMDRYSDTDPALHLGSEITGPMSQYLANARDILNCIDRLPCGVIEMRSDMEGVVMTSNNIGVLQTGDTHISLSCHTRSFDDRTMETVGKSITDTFRGAGADDTKLIMNTGAWMERSDSPLLKLTCDTFRDVLGFEPRKVAMHFVLEAAYYVQKYPGAEIASIGPLIIEPHSPSERVNLNTADNIWKVTVELLKRLAEK